MQRKYTIYQGIAHYDQVLNGNVIDTVYQVCVAFSIFFLGLFLLFVIMAQKGFSSRTLFELYLLLSLRLISLLLSSPCYCALSTSLLFFSICIFHKHSLSLSSLLLFVYRLYSTPPFRHSQFNLPLCTFQFSRSSISLPTEHPAAIMYVQGYVG